jgi:hypothetical protein
MTTVLRVMDRMSSIAFSAQARCSCRPWNMEPSASCTSILSTLRASALKGFSPTPEFPEIAEAQTLFTALAS